MSDKRYRFWLVCPRCGKGSETTSEKNKITVNCGDCLMDDIEIVEMKVRNVVEEPND